MRVLALDYGSARCGCAVSDPSGSIATPLQPVQRPGSRRGLRHLAALVRELEAERIVVGLPLSLSGGETAQTGETRAFARSLSEVAAVPVDLYDERLTTRLAARLGGRASEDSRAAALLLEDWLAARTNNGDSAPRGGSDSPKFAAGAGARARKAPSRG